MKPHGNKKVKIVTKGVTFNVLDTFQKELLDHALKTSNFSGYMKSLIVRDMLAQSSKKEEGLK